LKVLPLIGVFSTSTSRGELDFVLVRPVGRFHIRIVKEEGGWEWEIARRAFARYSYSSPLSFRIYNSPHCLLCLRCKWLLQLPLPISRALCRFLGLEQVRCWLLLPRSICDLRASLAAHKNVFKLHKLCHAGQSCRGIFIPGG